LIQERNLTQDTTWLGRFAERPTKELSALLGGYARIFPLERLDPSAILADQFSALPVDDPRRSMLDDAVLELLKRFRGARPSQLRAHGIPRLIFHVNELFLAAGRLRLPRTIAALGSDFSGWTDWARRLYEGDYRDARLGYWRLIARNQDLTTLGRTLASHWLNVCGEVGRGKLGRLYLQVAFDGLHDLPPPDGDMDSVDDLLHGITRWARCLPNDQAAEETFRTVWAGLSGRLGLTPQDIQGRLERVLSATDLAAAPFARWWAEALGVEPVRPPPTGAAVQIPEGNWKRATDNLIDELRAQGMPKVRDRLLGFVAGSEAFADATGETYHHSRNMNRLGQALLEYDPHLTLHLVESSLDRDPFDAHQYGLWARALMRLGRGEAAVKVLWQGIAIDPQSELERKGQIYKGVHRNILGGVLARLGRIAEAEALYQETRKEFPDDPVCRLDLGLLLLEHRPDSDAVEEVERLIAELRAMKHTAEQTLKVYLDRHRRGEPFRRGHGEDEEEQESGPLAEGELPEGLLAAADARRAEFLLGGALDDPSLQLMTDEDRKRLRAEAVETLGRLLADDPSNHALLLIARRYRKAVPALDVADADIVALADSTPVLAIAARRFGLVERDYAAVRKRWPDLVPLADWAEILDQSERSTLAAQRLADWIRGTDPKKVRPALARLHAELTRLCGRSAREMDAGVLLSLVAGNPEGLDDLLDICLLASIEVMPERRLLHFAV